MTRARGLVLVGLAVALFAGVLLSNFASPAPDGLESAVAKTQCPAEASAEELDACLAEAAGDPVFPAAPLSDYEFTPLSGLVGVLASFALAFGVVMLSRSGRSARGSSGDRSGLA